MSVPPSPSEIEQQRMNISSSEASSCESIPEIRGFFIRRELLTNKITRVRATANRLAVRPQTACENFQILQVKNNWTEMAAYHKIGCSFPNRFGSKNKTYGCHRRMIEALSVYVMEHQHEDRPILIPCIRKRDTLLLPQALYPRRRL